MNKTTLREHLAKLNHEAWSNRVQELMKQCHTTPEGVVIPHDVASKLKEESTTRFVHLSDNSKKSYRDEVEKHMNLIWTD